MRLRQLQDGSTRKIGIWEVRYTKDGKTVRVVSTSRKHCIEEAINYFFTGAYAYAGTSV